MSGRFKRFVAGVAVATAVAVSGGLAVAAAPASAATVRETQGVWVITLTHEETVAAAQVGAGNVINAILGNDHWRVTLDSDSKYKGGSYYRPDKGRTWSNVTGQQVIAEAAAHRGGYVVLGVFPDNPDMPLWVAQAW
ncbi:hypothetical protein [Williamsia soli]|uniref:hypothetical protein n=1 Tax=Williamsia soli TaxID=364929 RepID=UPI001A9E46A0|nr:hypothetical protein [Williamsia soli]